MKMTKNEQGFTLVELMIALLLTGVISVVIYSLFDTTSDNFIEVDNLADATDRARFALERVRSDVQMAGSQMSPDSANDTAWVQPTPNNYRVAGVMGAYDFPLAFEISGLIEDAGGNNEAAIVGHHRGLFRLHFADPFAKRLGVAQDFRDPVTAVPLVLTMFEGVTTRLIRISDRQGYQQFVKVTGEVVAADLVTTGDWPSLRLSLPPPNSTLGPVFKRGAGGGNDAIDFGLDKAPEGDIGYDAAFVDAFWYHVIPHPEDPSIMRLVRDRLCAPEVALAFTGGAVGDPGTLLADTCPDVEDNERVVVSDNVADFQVWFDCADAQGALSGTAAQTWVTTWATPAGGDCMTSVPPVPGQARVAHLRLTLHTPTERKNQAHQQFEDRTGVLAAPTPGAMLKTYDPYPLVPGAARVVTVQTDITLPNFSFHNVL